jgi:CRISPR-associated protein Cmr4
MSNSPNYFSALIGLRTLTSLHAGVMGGNHVLDRPIHRDIHSNWPKISSNALKGALREAPHWVNAAMNRNQIFGTEDYTPADDSERRLGKAGLMSFTDARLLLFPVRSARGVWAWITCPTALLRLSEEATLAGWVTGGGQVLQALANAISDKAIYAGKLLKVDCEHLLLYQHKFRVDQRLTPSQINEWRVSLPLLSELDDLVERMVIVSDENFGAMTQLYTEITTRNKINDDTSSTGGGTLFTEEHLPANALLYSMAFSMPDKTYQEIASLLDLNPKPIQIGGNATIGRGRCLLSWHISNF